MGRLRLRLLCGAAILGAGCLGGSPGPHEATLRIRVMALGQNGNSVVRTWTLGCGPPTGTHPDPRAACAALRDYAARYRQPTSACGCAAEPIGARYAVISGTLDGRRLDARLEACMCGVAERLIRDLQTATGL
jgi:Subtilisin inhibitor-like